MPTTPEDKYEYIDIIIKRPNDGVSWFDRIFDFITEDCEPLDNLDEENVSHCTCGMESMGGNQGTYDEVYAWSNSVGHGIPFIDLARVIVELSNNIVIRDEKFKKIIKWAKDEIHFEDHWNDPLPEDEGEDFRELTIDQEEG